MTRKFYQLFLSFKPNISLQRKAFLLYIITALNFKLLAFHYFHAQKTLHRYPYSPTHTWLIIWVFSLCWRYKHFTKSNRKQPSIRSDIFCFDHNDLHASVNKQNIQIFDDDNSTYQPFYLRRPFFQKQYWTR